MKSHPKLYDWVLLATLVVLFGSSFILIKQVGSAIPPLTAVMLRLWIAGLFMLVLAIALGHKLPSLREGSGRIAKVWIYFFFLAIIGNALPFTTSFWGMRHIDSSLGGILMSVNPLATLLLAHIFVADEKLTSWTVSGFSLGFLGMVILFGPDAWAVVTQQDTALIFQLAVACSALLYAANNVLARNVPPTSPIVVAACVLPLAAVLITPIALIVDGPPTSLPPPPPGTIAALLFLSIFTTAFATVVYMALVKSAGPTFLSLANYLVPLFAIAVGFFFANEIPSWNALVALVVLLSGIAVSQRRRPTIE